MNLNRKARAFAAGALVAVGLAMLTACSNSSDDLAAEVGDKLPDLTSQGLESFPCGDGDAIGGSFQAPKEPYVAECWTGSPSGTSAAIGNPVSGEYTPGSHVRGVSASASIDQGNVAGGIRSATFSSGAGSFQVEYDPPIAKDNTKVMTLNWQLSWGRYTE